MKTTITKRLFSQVPKSRKGFIRFSNISSPEKWGEEDCGTIEFRGGKFTMKKISNRLFVFCPDKVYEILKIKNGFKKIRIPRSSLLTSTK